MVIYSDIKCNINEYLYKQQHVWELGIPMYQPFWYKETYNKPLEGMGIPMDTLVLDNLI